MAAKKSARQRMQEIDLCCFLSSARCADKKTPVLCDIGELSRASCLFLLCCPSVNFKKGLTMLPSETELLERDIQNDRKARAKARKERFADEPVRARWKGC